MVIVHHIGIYLFGFSFRFPSCCQFYCLGFHGFLIKFMTSSDILYILRQFIIQLYGNISSSSFRAASTDIPDPLSLHVSLSFIASGRSSGLHPVSSHSCCMHVRAGRTAFDWPYAGVHRSTSLTISSLVLQQRPACLVRLAWIVFVIGDRWPYSWCLVGCCCQNLFNIALNILV